MTSNQSTLVLEMPLFQLRERPKAHSRIVTDDVGVHWSSLRHRQHENIPQCHRHSSQANVKHEIEEKNFRCERLRQDKVKVVIVSLPQLSFVRRRNCFVSGFQRSFLMLNFGGRLKKSPVLFWSMIEIEL